MRERESIERARQQAYYDAGVRGYMPPQEESTLDKKKALKDRFKIQQTKSSQNGEEYLFVHDTVTNTYAEMTRQEYDHLLRFGTKP